MKDYCEHCLTNCRFHIKSHFNYFLKATQDRLSFLKPEFLNGISIKIERWGWPVVLNLFSWIGIVKFESNPDPTQLRNRSLIFFKEAQKRNIDLEQIRFLGRPTNEFRMNYLGNTKYYEAVPLTVNKNKKDLDDKFRVKRLLAQKEVPVPEGQTFLRTSPALNYARELGFPLVVKPRYGSLSQHATWDINDQLQLKKAIQVARRYQPGFIVEKYLPGSLYRATVLGKEKVLICKKERANVVGDGNSTIEQLIKRKNKRPARGSTRQKNTTLHQIPINQRLVDNLKKQNLTLDSVLDKNEKVYLHRKIILSQGCDIIECTSEADPKNRDLFLKTANILKADLVGIDFIASDITIPYSEQRCGVIEANSLPYVDMHQHPSHGSAQPAAEITWDMVERQLKKAEK